MITAVLIVMIFAACSGDEGFRTDSRESGQDSRLVNDTTQSGGPLGGDAKDSIEPKPGQLPGRTHGDRNHGIWPQVWSQHAPTIQSWEYKVNCGEASSHIESCFLSDLTSVVVTTPSGEMIELEKDFYTNEFSGEVTRRWVLYGPADGNLPEKGDYVFSYSRGAELVYEQAIPYD